MVASEKEEVLGILDLVAKEKCHSLNRLFTAVNIVAKEQVVGFWRETTILEDS